MKWATGFLFLSLVHETLHQVITSSHSSSSASSSSSSRSNNEHQGFHSFGPRANNMQPFHTINNRQNSEMNAMTHHSQTRQNNGGFKSEAFSQGRAQTFSTHGRASQNVPQHNNHNGQAMMQNIHKQQFGPQNSQQAQHVVGDNTNQFQNNAHSGQQWFHTSLGPDIINNQHNEHQMNNFQPGQIIQNQHSKQLVPNHNQGHPLHTQQQGQHFIDPQMGPQLFNHQNPGHPMQNNQQGQQRHNQHAGTQQTHSPNQQHVTDSFGQHVFNGQHDRQLGIQNLGPQHPQVNFNHLQQNQIPNGHQWQEINNFGKDLGQKQMDGGRMQGQHTFDNTQMMKNQNEPSILQEHQHFGGQQQSTLRDSNPPQVLDFNTVKTQSKSESVSTSGFGGPVSNSVKTVSSVSTTNIRPTNAESILKPPFDASLFPRNFIIPESRRTDPNIMFPHMNSMNIHNTHNTFGPLNHQSQNAEGTSQTSSGNIFGFDSADRRPLREGFLQPNPVQNMSFQMDNPFGNFDAQRWPNNPRDLSLNPDLKVATCTEEYKSLPNHTMCLADAASLNASGVSELEQADIIRIHNEFRGSVLPEAADIFTMKWDDRLAIVAQKWANQCSRYHDRMRTVPSLGKHTLIGQNLAGGYSNWSSVIKEWWIENTIWQYGIEPSTYIPETSDVAETIGHYVQMTYNATYLVGCGYAYCENSQYEKYYVCNYAPGLRSFTHPFTIGERCKACPHWCRSGKCDCGGRVCNNGGTLNMRTCQCECGPLYAGPSCDILSCPIRDHPDCGVKYQRDHCVVNPQVNQHCPYMCGRCKRGHVMCGGRICFNGGSLRETSCRCSCSPPYTGETCEVNCSDQDQPGCHRWPDVFCHWNFQIQKDCPHRCNLCPGQ